MEKNIVALILLFLFCFKCGVCTIHNRVEKKEWKIVKRAQAEHSLTSDALTGRAGNEERKKERTIYEKKEEKRTQQIIIIAMEPKL